MTRVATMLLLIVCSCGRNDSTLFASDPTTSATDKLPLYVCHRAGRPLQIDGKLDDAEWGRVPGGRMSW